MKVQMVKLQGGNLAPAFESDQEAMTRFKNFEQYEIEIKLPRNPQFHRKVFEFFQFCFAHWKSDREFMDESGQFNLFRKNLTVLAGYYDEYFKINGEVRIEAKSLAYGSMEQTEFEKLYQALIQASMRHIFKNSDQQTYDKLMGFFW